MSAALSVRILHCYSKPGTDLGLIFYEKSQFSLRFFSWKNVIFSLYAQEFSIHPGIFLSGHGAVRPISVSAQREGYSKFWQRAMTLWVQGPQVWNTVPTAIVLFSEYVNAQELPTDMRSITDRAATTLLWTELFRGRPWCHFLSISTYAHGQWCSSLLILIDMTFSLFF